MVNSLVNKQGCVLAPTLFSLYFDSVIRLVITDHQPDVGVCLSYLLDADLIGNRKKLTSEVSVTDLEYADDIALISDSYESLSSLLEFVLPSHGLTINYKKTKLLAVLPEADTHSPSPISLHPDCDPIEVVPSFQYLGSYLSTDCTLDVEISTRISKASQSYGSLNCILGIRGRSSLVPSQTSLPL